VSQLDLGAAEQATARPVGNIRYGTSSWTDKTLLDSGEFYPPSATKPEERLRFYASQFPLVEVDSSYYALPSERNSELWAERTPPGFTFNVKAFGLLTGHGTLPRGLPERIRRDLPADTGDRQRIYAKDLPEPAMDLVWDMFNSALDPLAAAGKLGAVLFQFPKWFTATRGNAAYLHEVAERSRWPVALEFRGGFWMAEERQERRGEVDEAHRGRDHPPGRQAGAPDQQGDVKRRLVEEEPVRGLAVLAQALAVVGGDGDDRAGREAPALERGEETPHLGVGEGDLAVVGAPGMARGPGGGWRVRGVGVVEVDPEEEGPGVAASQPGQGPVHDLAPGPLPH